MGKREMREGKGEREGRERSFVYTTSTTEGAEERRRRGREKKEREGKGGRMEGKKDKKEVLQKKRGARDCIGKGRFGYVESSQAKEITFSFQIIDVR